MDSGTVDLGVYNANNQFEDRIYNTSGVTTEHTELLHAMQTSSTQKGNFLFDTNLDSNLTNEIGFEDENFAAYPLETFVPDLEIIAVDPNCFYSSEEDGDDDDDDFDEHDGDENDESDDVNVIEIDQNESHENHSVLLANPNGVDNNIYQQTQTQSSISVPVSHMRFSSMNDESFDIVNLNIDDNFLMDHHDDGILFASNKNEFHQFDLADYVVGEGSSLLLSPPPMLLQQASVPESSASKRLALNDNISKGNENRNDLTRTKAILAATQYTRTIAAGNRRKRKNLTREFIEDSSSSDSEDELVKRNLSRANEMVIQKGENIGQKQKKQRLRYDDDPTWNPGEQKAKVTIKGVCTKDLANNAAAAPVASSLENHQKDGRKSNANTSSIATPSSSSLQSNGLRKMLKKQLLSDRPLKKSIKLGTANATPTAITAHSERTKTQAECAKQGRVVGVGRGKDISITAKYYNCTDASDNSDRDNNNTENNLFESSSESSGETSSDTDGDNDNSNQSSESKATNPNVNGGNDKYKAKLFEQENTKSKAIETQIVAKNVEVKTKSNVSNVPILIDNSNLESNDFAKAIIVNTKSNPKCKPTPAATKNNLDKQKRLIQSATLLQNPAKFKIDVPAKLTPVPCQPFKELKSNLNSSINGKQMSAKTTNTISIKTEKLESLPQKQQQLKDIKSDETVKIDVKDEVNENLENDNLSMEIDVVSTDDNKIEPTIKKKLNIQEYLKRKNIKSMTSNSSSFNYDTLANIKVESSEQDATKSNASNPANENEMQTNCSVEQSMYEEIIIVSIGCNTIISIPETSFKQQSNLGDTKFAIVNETMAKSTVLLSNIQTTIEKAESAKISRNSLISSIQDVILKKTTTEIAAKNVGSNMPSIKSTDAQKSDESEEPEHGENKVIMHLRKDRVRPSTTTISIQTESYFQFPPLIKLAPISKKAALSSDKYKNFGNLPKSDSVNNEMNFMHSSVGHHSKSRAHRNYRPRPDLSESSYYSEEEVSSPQRRSRHSDFFDAMSKPPVSGRNTHYRRRDSNSHSRRKTSRYRSSKHDKHLNRQRTISRSLSQSSDTSTSSTNSATSTSSSSSASSMSSTSSKSLNSYGGSSSQSYYGFDYKHYRQRQPSSQSYRSRSRLATVSCNRAESPEERRIVYVGRIEEGTTKDDLRRKFSVYGTVKNVSIHYKEMKWKYGFVTFDRPIDAYNAIDNSSKNPAIRDYDVSFGGRRAFCREKYLDLDNTGDSYSQMMNPLPIKLEEEDSFEALLKKVKDKLQEAKQ